MNNYKSDARVYKIDYTYDKIKNIIIEVKVREIG